VSTEARTRARLEPPDIAPRPVIWAALGALLLLGGAIGGFDVIYRRAVPVRSIAPPQAFPEPQLRTDERAQRLDLQARQRDRLSGYHWADPNRALVQIPIERAMQIVAQEGDQAYAPLVPSADGPPAKPAGGQP
jgi:hypothetical protein